MHGLKEVVRKCYGKPHDPREATMITLLADLNEGGLTGLRIAKHNRECRDPENIRPATIKRLIILTGKLSKDPVVNETKLSLIEEILRKAPPKIRKLAGLSW